MTEPRLRLYGRSGSHFTRVASMFAWELGVAVERVVVRDLATLEAVAYAENPALKIPTLAQGGARLFGALGWLDAHVDEALATLPADRALSLLEVSLFCLVEHVAFRPMVPTGELSRRRGFAVAYGARESARRTPYALDP